SRCKRDFGSPGPRSASPSGSMVLTVSRTSRSSLEDGSRHPAQMSRDIVDRPYIGNRAGSPAGAAGAPCLTCRSALQTRPPPADELSMSVRVVIADDHPLSRTGVREFLQMEDQIEVVGEAADGQELLALLERCPADVALIDTRMPNMG